MAFVPDKIATWQMVQAATRDKETGETIPGRFELVEIPMPELTAGEVLVEIAGCGVCQTDLNFFYDGILTASKPALTLGHEISGTVVAGETSWLGREVLIVASMSSAQGAPCETGLDKLCRTPMIRGAGAGIYGGFSSHIVASASSLCAINNRKTIPLEHLAAVADTVPTAFHAAKRASLAEGDNVLVIGAAGISPFIVQIVKSLGARTVLVVDNVATCLQNIRTCGADVIINTTTKGPKEIAAEVKDFLETGAFPSVGWKIFVATGTESGLKTGLALLGKKGKLIHIVSETTTVAYDITHLRALDAEIITTWGCPGEDYPQVVDMVTSGKIALSPFVQTRPMSWIREVFAEARIAPPHKHILLTADDVGLDDTPEPKSCR